MPPIGGSGSTPHDGPQGSDTPTHRFSTAFDVEACYRYTRSRQTSQGGFCFYAYPQWGVEEPNSPDTCAAVAIFDLLGVETPDTEHCKAWLSEQQDASGGFQTAVIAYATLKALHLLGAEPRRSPQPFLRNWGEALRIADPPTQKRDGWLVGALHCIELWRCFGVEISEPVHAGIAAALERLKEGDGGYGAPGSNLPETAAALALATAVGLPGDREMLSYAQRCEAAPLGFNVTPYAISSSLETQLAGLRVLGHFGSKPQCAALIWEFARSCQTPLGGFGRTPGAIARLDDTLRALQIFVLLNSPDVKDQSPGS